MVRYLAMSCLLMLSLCLVHAQPVTLLKNPDFEEPQLGWGSWPDDSQAKYEIDKTVAQSGIQSLRITSVRSGDRAYAIAPLITLDPGVVYRVSYYVRREGTVPPRAVGLNINWRDPQTKVIKNRCVPSHTRINRVGEWEQRSGLIISPDDGTQAEFLLWLQYAAGRVWFDNVTIERLGPPSELKTDVWTNQTIGVEIGSGPISRFSKHMADNTPIYQMGVRYNDLVFQSAFAESRLRDLERCSDYAGKDQPTDLREEFDAAEWQLNATYGAYTKAFKSGEPADNAAFTAAADKLATMLQKLDTDVAAAYQVIRPAQPVPLPAKLGRQPRSVRPIEPNGRMNRLLFGAWSPTQFTEAEKPFQLEFHSSAPGAPKVHTETELDFSNITEACDNIEKLGYNGTFSYLAFGIHEYLYAPQWFVDKHKAEPDFFKLSQDGLKGTSGGSGHSLNWLHPAVQAYIKDYLGKYAAFCKNEPRILFYEVAQEAYPYFTTEKGIRETGYGPHGEAAFRQWLQAKYRTIAALNNEWGATYPGFDAIQPPPDAYLGRKEITPLVAEFEAFRDDAYIGYLKLIYDSLKAADPDKPVVARHSGLLSVINGARLFETCDVLSYHRGAPQMQLGHVYLNSLNRYAKKGLGYMEDFWGKQEEQDRVWDERAQRRGLEKHICRSSTWGRSLQMKWYGYTSGAYIFEYNGNWFNPQYDLTTIRYCAPALAVAKRKMEQVDWILTHSEIAPSKVLVLQPSATMRIERPDQSVYGTLLALHAGLYNLGVLYELVPEEYFQDGRAKFSDFNAIILPGAKYLSADLQEKLLTWARSGKQLVLIGENGTYDDLARPCGVLKQALGADHTATDLWRGGKEVAVGKGRAWIIPQLSGMVDYMDLPKAMAAMAAHPVQGYYLGEHVLRVTEDGEKYLFILNPDVDHPIKKNYIELDFPVKEAIDILAPDGFPVPVETHGNRATIQLRLGPGETTVLWLR